MVDFLLNGPCGQQSVDGHLLFLANPPSALPCLTPETDPKQQRLNKLCCINDGGCGRPSDLRVSAGVPVGVIDDDSVGSSQINSQTPDFSGQKEDKNGVVL